MAAGKVKPIRSEKAGSGAEPKVRRLNRSWRGVSVEPVCGNCAGAGAGARRGQGTPPPGATASHGCAPGPVQAADLTGPLTRPVVAGEPRGWNIEVPGGIPRRSLGGTLAMNQPTVLQVDYFFRGVEHAVRVVVSGQVLELEVEDRMTADQWRGEFDANFIEDLTHKTGNFKQFSIFCNMLESALTQSSESVTLDLLTYTDLESLRSRKLGGRPGSLAPRSAQLNSKRYLILIYSVEFDRIHYPLPLPYQGKPDPVVLQGIIRSLKEELGRLRGLDGGQDTRDTREAEIWHLREQVTRLASEKRELEVQLGRSREEALAGRAARQEAEALRGLVRGLETELRQERGLGGRAAGRRSQDCRRLAKELEEVKASERNLRARLKTLNNELALYRRGRRNLPASAPAREDRASTSRERSTSRGRAATRSSSRESGRGARGRGRPPRPSPSPTGARAPRFDPTAFVKAKEKKQREIRMKQQQQQQQLQQRNRTGSGGSGDGPSVSWTQQTRPATAMTARGDANRSRNRSSSVDSFRSRCSSVSSCSDLDFSESVSRSRRCRVRGKPPSPTPWSGRKMKSTTRERSNHQRHLANSGGWVPVKEYSPEYQGADMAEIDARLKALQEYMNRLDTRS